MGIKAQSCTWYGGTGGGTYGARRHPSRGMYVLPSLFTAGNIAAGFYCDHAER